MLFVGVGTYSSKYRRQNKNALAGGIVFAGASAAGVPRENYTT